LSIEIEKPVLEKVCMEVIETALLCLPNAFKGTVYRVRKSPELITERITSGIIDDLREKISWGLPTKSEYNPPGKPWVEYRDQPGRPLEAMAWCVAKQKSWTAADPATDARSVRLQVEGVWEDCFHMEPVLVPKSDLRLDRFPLSKYPRDYEGNVICKDSEYLVVAVIKIHFNPGTIKIGSHETRVIKKLSRSLGTELLSYQLRQDSMRTMQELATDRLNACNILADSLRNVIAKSGLILSLVKQEIGCLRDQWEQILLEHRKEKDMKAEAIRELNKVLMTFDKGSESLREDLIAVQNRFLELSLSPEKAEKWVIMQIEDRWNKLLYECPQNDKETRMIWQTIDELKKAVYFGKDPDIIADYGRIPEELRVEFVKLIYGDNERFNASALARLIEILDNPALTIPSRKRSKKILKQLKALAETMSQLERDTNFLLGQVLNGSDDALANGAPNNIVPSSKGKHESLST